MGKEIRDNFERKRKPVLRCLGDWVFTKPCKHEVNCNFCCICASNRVIFLIAVFFMFFGYPYGRKTHCTERTSHAFCYLKYAFCMAILCFDASTHWNLECPLAGILKYPKNMVFGRILS
jgi:hypothetical protein